jgi:hydroxypyruvate isomerase
MQIADHPGRHQPGTGEINYSFLMEYLDQIEYKNWVGCEYYPKGHSKKSLEWAADWL